MLVPTRSLSRSWRAIREADKFLLWFELLREECSIAAALTKPLRPKLQNCLPFVLRRSQNSGAQLFACGSLTACAKLLISFPAFRFASIRESHMRGDSCRIRGTGNLRPASGKPKLASRGHAEAFESLMHRIPWPRRGVHFEFRFRTLGFRVPDVSIADIARNFTSSPDFRRFSDSPFFYLSASA